MVNDELKRAFAEDIVFLRRCGVKPVVVHGGGPQISSMLARLGHRQRVQGRPARHHPRGHGRRPDGARRPGRPRAGRPAQRARTARRRHVRRGRRAVHRQAPRHRASTARRSTSAWSARSSRCDTEAMLDLIDAGRIPVVATVAPDEDGAGPQRERRHRRRGAGGRAGRRAADRAHRRRGPVRRLAEHATRGHRARSPRPSCDACCPTLSTRA